MKADIQKSRAAALLLALCLIAVFSLSALFVVSHADHDCTGTDCAVCHEIHSCLSALRHISEGLGPSAPLWTGRDAPAALRFAACFPVGPAFLYLDCTENSSEQLKRPPSKGKVCPFLNGRFCLAFLRPKTGKYADLEVTIA